MIPVGWKVTATVPAICDADLCGKKCMFLLEKTKEQKVGGWFAGRIAGVSFKAGCNYNVKYDRLETGTLFVDGIRNVWLDLIGDNAYGKRWVLLVDTPLLPGQVPILMQKKSRFG